MCVLIQPSIQNGVYDEVGSRMLLLLCEVREEVRRREKERGLREEGLVGGGRRRGGG